MARWKQSSSCILFVSSFFIAAYLHCCKISVSSQSHCFSLSTLPSLSQGNQHVTNLATLGTAYQSTTSDESHHSAKIANDGDIRGGYSHTQNSGDRNTWWKVTFPQGVCYSIHKVIIHTRQSYSWRLNGFGVLVKKGDTIVQKYGNSSTQ